MDQGTYALVLVLDQPETIAIGALKLRFFPEGYYIYVGSALNGLYRRLQRHLRDGKRLYWHVDYFRQQARVHEAWYVASPERLECEWYRAVESMPGGQPHAPGFGSSGCGCPTHLVYFEWPPSFEAFRLSAGLRDGAVRRASPGDLRALGTS